MSRVVRCGVTQVAAVDPTGLSMDEIREAMFEKHRPLVEEAAQREVRILCLQELCTAPYFAAEQDARWYELAEEVPDGPTVSAYRELAARCGTAMVVPVYERATPGLFFNTAAVIDADGDFLGRYRKTHIPHCAPGFWEKFYFAPGDLGYPVFATRHGRVGVSICYDRHFPEVTRALGLGGAQIVFVPSATTRGHSDHLWKLEQRAHAVANGFFVGTCNRVGVEAPWRIGEFYGTSYFCDPRGEILAEGCDGEDELVSADLDLARIDEVRAQWQFYRDRRPESYGDLFEYSAV